MTETTISWLVGAACIFATLVGVFVCYKFVVFTIERALKSLF